MKLFKKTSSILFLTAITVSFLVSCKGTDPIDEPLIKTNLVAKFASASFDVDPDNTIDLPFTITGVEGAVLSVTASSSNPDATVKVSIDADYQGEVTFKAPSFSDGSAVTVTLNVNDPVNKRETTATTSVNVTESDPLTLTISSDIKSVSVRAGGKVSIPFTVGGATTKVTPTVSANNGWSATATVENDNKTGEIVLTAPASVGTSVKVDLTIKDEKNREASFSQEFSVVEISSAANAANCFIVKPGESVTISAVEGNSTKKIIFNSASLVWEDEIGLIAGVGGNDTEGVVVVKTNSGKTGNAVVAAKQDGVIVWSWHVWVTDYDPSKDVFAWTDAGDVTYTFMDRDLGARSNEKYSSDAFGLFYQWGRKDPFASPESLTSSTQRKTYDADGNRVYLESRVRPVFPDHTTTALDSAIQHPTVFYTAPSSAWPVVDWLTDEAGLQDNDLWGGISGVKSKYDPCPTGWKVPKSGAPWGFRSQYKKEGKLNDDSKYDPTYPWYAEYEDAYCIGFRYKDTSGKEFWFPWAGHINCNNGKLQSIGGGGQTHTASVSGNLCVIETFAWGNPASEAQLNRPYGSNVRCIKE